MRHMRRMYRKAVRGLLPAAITASSIAVFLGSTQAALAAACPPPPGVVHPFLPWDDPIDYVPVTNGSFAPIKHGSKELPWTLSGDASLVPANEPFLGGGDDQALYLGEGGTAVSACTTAPHIASTVRFFARSVGSASGLLHVEVLVNDGKNGILDGGLISAGSDWAPTDVIVVPWAKPLKGAVDLRVRLTAVGTGAAFEIDDVYIDPCKSR